MITPTHSKKRFETNRVFTGREDERALFRAAVTNEQAPDVYRVLMWYGIGGQGKSALFRECQRILNSISDAAVNLPNKRSHVWARVDFEESHYRRPEEALRSIRLQLARQGQVSFPSFDAAFALYMLKTNPGTDIRQRYPELFRGESEVVDDLVELSEGILGIAAEVAGAVVPAANIIYKWGARLTGRLHDWWDQRGKTVLKGIDALLPDELLERMPTYLGADLCDAQQTNLQLRPVVLLDTYEALWRDRAQKDGVSDRRADQWVRLLVQDSPGTLFVIFGRDKLRWAEFDPDWAEVVDTHLLGKISDEDADDFLRQIPIEDAEIRGQVIDGAEGLPFYLDLQVDLFEKFVTGDETPEPQHFGGSHGDILDRFLDHLNDSEQDVLRLACYLDAIAQDELCNLVDTFPGRVANFRWSQLISRSFFTRASDNEFLLHALMREELQRREKAEDPKQFERIHMHLFALHEAKSKITNSEAPTLSNERALLDAWRHISIVNSTLSLNFIVKSINNGYDISSFSLLENILELALNLSKLEKLKKDDSNLISLKFYQARQFKRKYQYEKSEKILKELYEIVRLSNKYGEGNLSTIVIRHDLARIIGYNGRNAEAEEEFRQIYEILQCQDISDRNVLRTALVSRTNMARQIAAQGRYDEAEIILKEIHEFQSTSDQFGPENPDTLATQHDIADTLVGQKRLQEAEAFYRECYEIRQRPDVLGPNNPHTLLTRSVLAQQIADQGRFAEAEAEYRAIWEVEQQPDVLGEEHPRTLLSKFELAKILDRLDRMDEASELFVGLRDAFQRALPEGSDKIQELEDYLAQRFE